MPSPAEPPVSRSVRDELRARFGADCEQSREVCSGPGALSAQGREELVYDPYNHRLKLIGVAADEVARPEVSRWLDGLRSADAPYSKLIVYALPGGDEEWRRHGYLREGVIHGYFPDGADACIHSAFAAGGRAECAREDEFDAILGIARSKSPEVALLPEGYRTRAARVDDAEALASLLGEVFADYPTPIDAASLAARIEAGVNVFRLATDRRGEVVAAASAELDEAVRSAELTDCATRPECRGTGLMRVLLQELEQEAIHRHGVNGLYTIARAGQIGMNCAFARLGWVCTGRLRHNCRMPSGWESMNLWCAVGARDEVGSGARD